MRRIDKSIAVFAVVLLLAGLLPAKTTPSSAKKKSSTTHAKSATTSTKSKASKSSSSAHVHSAKATKGGKHGRKSPKTKKIRGQQSIQSDRTREIQAALIREHYLDGEPSGDFDQRTKAALQKYQQDNGWQTKVIPDSRALIKLGLGPSKDGLLNPESAAMGSPYELGTEREIPGGAVTPAQRK